MKTLILDGFEERDTIRASCVEAAVSIIAERGWEGEVLTIRDLAVSPCAGCFGCWTRSPGICVNADDALSVKDKIVKSDLLLIITPLTFGGYSSLAKKILDRSIGLLSPLFTLVKGEVRHRQRYDNFPAMAALGINEGGCEKCPEIFRTLVYRNAVNFHAPNLATDVVERSQAQGNILEARIARLLNQVRPMKLSGLPARRVRVEEIMPRSSDGPLLELPRAGPAKALFLVGSPRANSTSSLLSDELTFRFRGKGWETWRHYIMRSMGSEERLLELIHGMETADLVVLLSPLYVDSLPASVTRVMELIGLNCEKRADSRRPGFMAVLNCGFPEASNNFTGLAITKHFAEETGYVWMGGLALGMGAAIGGKSFKGSGRMIRSVSDALDLAVEHMAYGNPVPRDSVDLMARPLVPVKVYVTMGNRGWKKQAKKQGVRGDLNARPYE